MIRFDAYGFYEQLLEQAAQTQPDHDLFHRITQPGGFVAVARAGFDAQRRNVAWNDQCASFARAAEQDAYGLESLADYEEWAVGICCFAAFSIGAELAFSLSGELSETERFLAAAVLPGFILNEAAVIAGSIAPSLTD